MKHLLKYYKAIYMSSQIWMSKRKAEKKCGYRNSKNYCTESTPWKTVI